MIQNKYIFLRNDDVRGELDDELIELTGICVRNKIPLSLAVEPANVSVDVVDWLLDIKSQNPELIEIIQHGYDHNIKNQAVKMEFGGNRTYLDQLQSLRAGIELMDSYFKNQWSQVFTFPYGTFNKDTLKIIDELGYKAISSKIEFSHKNLLKNRIGTFLKKDFLFGKRISYHPGIRSTFKFKEISVSANVIKKYVDQKNAIHYSSEEVSNQIANASIHTDIIGLLFHHRFHTKELSKIEELLKSLKENYKFSTIMDLVR